jgi:hypothetical protein
LTDPHGIAAVVSRGHLLRSCNAGGAYDLSPTLDLRGDVALQVRDRGGVSIGVKPMVTICCRISGSAAMALSLAWSLATISFGVLAGAANISQPAASKPGTPASAIGVISGAAAARAIEDTPSGRILPSLISGSDGGRSTNIAGIWPPRKSVIAGAVPLYGTSMMSMPVMLLSNSVCRCAGEPGPLVANMSWPGFSFASLIRSVTVRTESDGCTTSTNGMPATSASGTKSFAGS